MFRGVLFFCLLVSSVSATAATTVPKSDQSGTATADFIDSLRRPPDDTGGVGLQLDSLSLGWQDGLPVAAVEGSPAKRAGIKPSDRLIEVDGVSIKGMPLEQVAKKIRGTAGTKVALSFNRAGAKRPVQLLLTREPIRIWYGHRNAAYYKQALIRLRPLADQGMPEAQNSIGVLYESGLAVKRDYGRAAYWYRKSATQGNPDAQMNLAALYQTGRGVKQDYAESYFWTRLAAVPGRYEMTWGGAVRLIGADVVEEDRRHLTEQQIIALTKRAAEWRPVSASTTANTNAPAADVPLDKPNMDEVALLSWATDAASQALSFGFENHELVFDRVRNNFTPEGWKSFRDDIETSGLLRSVVEGELIITTCPSTLATPMCLGRGKPKSTETTIHRQGIKDGLFRWIVDIPLLRKTQHGNVATGSDLGVILTIVRVSTKQNPAGVAVQTWVNVASQTSAASTGDKSALTTLQSEAAQGHATAQYMLGCFYYQGRGVKKDYAEAAKWIEQAAEQRLGRAQVMLGAMYDKGKGVKQDDVLAYMWYDLGHWDLTDISKRMTPEQIAEGKRLAAEWKPVARIVR